MTPRIAVDGREWLTGRQTGIGRFLEDLLERAVQRGEGPVWHVYLAPEGEARLEAPALTYEKLPRLPAPLIDQLVLPARLRADPPDLFFSPYIKLPWRLPCPGVATVHDLMLLSLPPAEGGLTQPRRAWFRFYTRRSLKTAGLVVTVSESSRREIGDQIGPIAAPIEVIPEPAGRIFRESGGLSGDEVRARLALGGPFLMAVGNFSPHKNLALLVRAWADLQAEGIAGDLLLAGAGEGREAIRELARSLGVAETVRFPGRVDDDELPALYRETAGLLQPSLSEGFGLPVVEAMASGAPIVVSNRGSLPEVAGGAGPVLDPADRRAWAGAMRALLTDPELRRRRSEAARDRAGCFTPEETTDRLLARLEGMLTRGR